MKFCATIFAFCLAAAVASAEATSEGLNVVSVEATDEERNLYNQSSCKKKCRVKNYFPKEVCEKACQDVTENKEKKPCKKDCYGVELRKVRRKCRGKCKRNPKPEPKPKKIKINGADCDKADIVIVDKYTCKPGAPHFNLEGAGCHDQKGYCSYDVGPNTCARCDTKTKKINGADCDKANIVIVDQWEQCIPGRDLEGAVCDEGPWDTFVNYCSYDVGPNACAFCYKPPPGTVFCPNKPLYCDCSWDCDARPKLCTCPEAQKCCSNTDE